MRLPAYAGAAGGGAVTACYRPLICISGLALARCLVSRFHGSLRGHRCDLCSSTWIKRLLSTSPVLLGRYLLCWAVDAIVGFAAENPLLGALAAHRSNHFAPFCASCERRYVPDLLSRGFVHLAFLCSCILYLLAGGRCHRWIRGRRPLLGHSPRTGQNHFAPFYASCH